MPNATKPMARSTSKTQLQQAEQDKTSTSRASKFQDALNHVQTLLNAHEASEELARTWVGSTVASTGQSMGLSHLHRLLDAGKRVSSSTPERGIPMWMVVRTVKASWHADGSWPLLGSDEAAQHPPTVRPSIHPSGQLLRPKGQVGFAVPQTPVDADLAAGKVITQDPDPQDVAQRYAHRGIDVGPVPFGSGFEDWS